MSTPANIQQLKEEAKNHLLTSAAVKQQLAETQMENIFKAAELIATSFKAGGKLLLCGNGGSAADCQHMATEFVSRLSKDFIRPGLPALALTTDTSFLTAHTNDYGYDEIFERQVVTFGKPEDVLIGISTSGGSANVIRAIEAAHSLKMKTIALVGNTGRMASLATVAVSVPHHQTQFIQESHLAVEHIICALVERYVYGECGSKK